MTDDGPPEPAPPDPEPREPVPPESGPVQPSAAWTPPAATPTSPAAATPPPSAPPPAAPPGTPGWYPPPGVAPGYAPPQKTNNAAIISLIAGIAQFVICPFVGAIVAIVTGHVARGQIKRAQGAEGGRGLATAGLVLGYVGIALTVLAIVALIVFFAAFADDVERASLRSDARWFVDRAQEQANFRDGEVRDPEVLQVAYAQYVDDDGSATITLADGMPIFGASVDDWERNRWQIELEGDFDAFVCAQVPTEVFEDPVVRNGRCASAF
jgi:hypothetical protein